MYSLTILLIFTYRYLLALEFYLFIYLLLFFFFFFFLLQYHCCNISFLFSLRCTFTCANKDIIIIKSSEQCNIAAAKAKRILGIIIKNLFMKGRYCVIEVV